MRRLRLAAWGFAAAALIAGDARAGTGPRYGGTVAAAIPGPVGAIDPGQAATPAALFAATLVHQPPLRRDADGNLVPVLLAELPTTPDGGRTFVLRLREGLRFHDGRPLRAADLAASLRRLEAGPWAGLVLPVAATTVRSETVLEVRLDPPLPGWIEALAEPGAAVVPEVVAGASPPGLGPFVPAAGGRYEAFEGHAEGRPFLDAVELLQQPDRRAAAKLVSTGRAALGPAPRERGQLASWLFVGPAAPQGLHALLAASIDRSDLVRFFVPGAASPLPPLPASSAPQQRAPVEKLLALRYDPAVEGHRQVAERIQLRLHDRGVRVRLEPLAASALRGATGSGAYELALVQLPVPAHRGLAAASLLLAAGRPAEARRLLAAVAAGGDPAAALAAAGGLVPLYAATEAISFGPAAGVVGTGPADAWTATP